MPSDLASFLIEPADLLSTYCDLSIIDTRQADQYAAGHIPGAINLSTYDMFVKSTSEIGLSRFQRAMETIYGQSGLDMTQPVVVYESQTGMRAARECWMLQYMGHQNVRMLHGGFMAWQQAGGQIATSAASLTPREFSSTPQPQMLIGVRGIMAHAGLSDFGILDVRTYEEFMGAGGSSCCVRQGRIPGARWIEWNRFFDEETGRFLSSESVRELLYEHGIQPGQDIVAYCHRGARSAVVYYALLLAGCPQVRNFIGSWHEWSARNDLPIETGA